MKLIWIAVGVIILIMVVGGYLSVTSGITELGPVMSEFSSALGKVVGGIVLIVSGLALAGALIHYNILLYRRRRAEKQKEELNQGRL